MPMVIDYGEIAEHLRGAINWTESAVCAAARARRAMAYNTDVARHLIGVAESHFDNAQQHQHKIVNAIAK